MAIQGRYCGWNAAIQIMIPVCVILTDVALGWLLKYAVNFDYSLLVFLLLSTGWVNVFCTLLTMFISKGHDTVESSFYKLLSKVHFQKKAFKSVSCRTGKSTLELLQLVVLVPLVVVAAAVAVCYCSSSSSSSNSSSNCSCSYSTRTPTITSTTNNNNQLLLLQLLLLVVV